jgi:hypothetical protein
VGCGHPALGMEGDGNGQWHAVLHVPYVNAGVKMRLT